MKPRLMLSFFLLLLAALLVPVAAAQSGVSIEFDAVDSDQSPQVQDADFPRLTVTFTPLSDSGVPIAGLTRELNLGWSLLFRGGKALHGLLA